jgi:hypothetical protein
MTSLLSNDYLMITGRMVTFDSQEPVNLGHPWEVPLAMSYYAGDLDRLFPGVSLCLIRDST